MIGDTLAHIEAQVIASLRALSPAQKLALARWATELALTELLEWALTGQAPPHPGDISS